MVDHVVGVQAEGGTDVVLTECHVRADRFVARKGAKAVRYDWKRLCGVLAPHGSSDAHKQLRRATPGAFLGLSKNRRTGKLGTFFMFNPDRSGDFRHVLRADPEFELRLVSVYRVEEVNWEAKLKEYPNPAAAADGVAA